VTNNEYLVPILIGIIVLQYVIGAFAMHCAHQPRVQRIFVYLFSQSAYKRSLNVADVILWPALILVWGTAFLVANISERRIERKFKRLDKQLEGKT